MSWGKAAVCAALAVIGVGLTGCSGGADAKERERAVVSSIETELKQAASRCAEYEFDAAVSLIDHARGTLDNSSLSPDRYDELDAKLREAQQQVSVARRDFLDKTSRGYELFEGQLVTSAEKRRLLAEREKENVAPEFANVIDLNAEYAKNANYFRDLYANDVQSLIGQTCRATFCGEGKKQQDQIEGHFNVIKFQRLFEKQPNMYGLAIDFVVNVRTKRGLLIQLPLIAETNAEKEWAEKLVSGDWDLTLTFRVDKIEKVRAPNVFKQTGDIYVASVQRLSFLFKKH